MSQATRQSRGLHRVAHPDRRRRLCLAWNRMKPKSATRLTTRIGKPKSLEAGPSRAAGPDSVLHRDKAQGVGAFSLCRPRRLTRCAVHRHHHLRAFLEVDCSCGVNTPLAYVAFTVVVMANPPGARLLLFYCARADRRTRGAEAVVDACPGGAG